MANLDDLPYPLWIENVSDAPSTSGGGAAPRSGPLAPATVLGDILGWRVDPNNPRAFQDALAAAFPLVKGAEGHLVPKYTPRTYNVQSLQTGIGALTGGQASIYTRTKLVVEQVQSLVDELVPLAGGGDDADIAPIRDLIKPALADLVEQLGNEGGPVVPRIDNIFTLVAGWTVPQGAVSYTTGTIGGYAGLLRFYLGMDEVNVNNIAEEETFTKFATVVDWLSMLVRDWSAVRGNFSATGSSTTVFFGTQLHHIQNELSCVAGAIRDVIRAMDSVFFDAAERETFFITPAITSTTGPSVSVADILRWGLDIASNRGLAMLESKDGVANGFLPTMKNYQTLVDGYLKAETAKNSSSGAMQTARVQYAVGDLSAHVATVIDLADAIVRYDAPVVTQVLATSGIGANFVVNGKNFDEVAPRVIWTRNGAPLDVRVVAAEQGAIFCDVTNPGQGTFEVTVINRNGQSSAAFTFNA
jgi:hypothetical protein